LPDGLAAMKVAEVALAKFPDAANLILTMIQVIKKANLKFEKLETFLIEKLMQMDSGTRLD